jgi:hypothetical protein
MITLPDMAWIGWDGELKFPSAHHLKDPIMAIARDDRLVGRLLDGREYNQFPSVKE